MGVPFTASWAACLIASICEMPSGVAGSPSWEMIIRAALPSADRNNFRPRWKSGLSKASGGR
ncbi:Uncharacterised protein [Mycobacterium tuberculosis]|nr:Uncharacterised protein [Mycobacterium tuberculosis]COW90303.1 Uncharacterised protein [Mycobacterium tuberculosis]